MNDINVPHVLSVVCPSGSMFQRSSKSEIMPLDNHESEDSR